jgi:PIF1-like helicase
MLILRRYVLEDLLFHPISARQFGRYLKAAVTTLVDLFHNDVLGDYSPTITDIMLKEQASEVLKQQEFGRRKALVDALFDDTAVAQYLPLELRDPTSEIINYSPRVAQVSGISDAAFAEQQSALACCIRAIDNFLQPTCRGVKFPCLVGRPGSGKSHILKLAVVYCLCKNLRVEMMAWTSERARKVGGSHLHLVFPLAVTNNRLSFSQDIVNDCLRRLERDTSRREMLKRTDVFIFEEIGLLSAEYFVALDAVLRVLMANGLPWGGKLLLSCGDAKQLPPVEGTMIWSSVNMCTMMEVFVFKVILHHVSNLPLLKFNAMHISVCFVFN